MTDRSEWIAKKAVGLFLSGESANDPEERRARAYAAKALLDDPTLQAGWAELESNCVNSGSAPFAAQA